MLTAVAKLLAAATCGRSQTWTESFWLAATVPAARRWLVNGTALPGIRATAGVGAALANPLRAHDRRADHRRCRAAWPR